MAHNTTPSQSLPARIGRLLHHRVAEGQLRRALSPALMQALTTRVAASEARHTGQICLCIEGGLPLSYLWAGASARERALAQFGKMRVWDTAHNNGVLIYLLVAEHAIEIVADRGLAEVAPPAVWQAMVARMREAFQGQKYEEGLTTAIAEVTTLLVAHFPAQPGETARTNELPDAPLVLR